MKIEIHGEFRMNIPKNFQNPFLLSKLIIPNDQNPLDL